MGTCVESVRWLVTFLPEADSRIWVEAGRCPTIEVRTRRGSRRWMEHEAELVACRRMFEAYPGLPWGSCKLELECMGEAL